MVIDYYGFLARLIMQFVIALGIGIGLVLALLDLFAAMPKS